MIEEKYRFRLPQVEGGSNVANPEEDHSLSMGLGTSSSVGRMSVMCMPALSEFIGGELAKEAAISKGKVKAHELRESIKKMGGGGGGEGGKDKKKKKDDE